MTKRIRRFAVLLGGGVGLVGLFGTSGCFRSAKAAPLTARQTMTFDQSLIAARNGEQFGPMNVDGYSVRSLPNGGIEVMRPGMTYEGRVPVRGVNNALITTKVKSVFAADPNVSSMQVHVDTDSAGIVTLTGDVPTSTEAATAIQDALNVVGVNAVRSYITFATAPAMH